MSQSITAEELKQIKDQQTELGQLEASKHAMLHRIAGVNESIEETKKELETKYGSVNINLEDGTYTPVQKEEEIDGMTVVTEE